VWAFIFGSSLASIDIFPIGMNDLPRRHDWVFLDLISVKNSLIKYFDKARIVIVALLG
jgi:hypothetical protein